MINSHTQSELTPGSPTENPQAPYRVCVCICTFKRTDLLARLLESLTKQNRAGLFNFAVVVADNDCQRSAEPVVRAFAEASSVPITYCVEPQQNIAMVRNLALRHAEGDFVAFIDDDEVPCDNWLEHLLRTCLEFNVEGVLGPIKPAFEVTPPEWVTKGGFFNRPTYPTGFNMTWDKTRTGNVLFKADVLHGVDFPFRTEFATAGEDMDFFRRMMQSGHRFVWSNEAVVYESVPSSRCTRTSLLKRALLRGSNFPKHPKDRAKNIAKSVIAIPCYAVALPVLAMTEQALFVKYLVKLADHVSRLLAFVGLPLMTQREA